MFRLAATIRLVLGLAMVAGGATLAAPLAHRLILAVQKPPVVEVPMLPEAAAPAAATPPAMAEALAGPVWDAPPASDPAVPGIPETGFADGPQPVGPPALALQMDYQPPPPPAPLPPTPGEFTAPGPGMNGAYRSALAVPPPPLLDTTRPPPLAVSWSANDRPQAAVGATHVTPAAVPATYRVRDGDDLAGIATRFYGHPGAAAAVWAANRDVVADPGLLPINAELRLPPPWTVRIAGAGGDAAIEPGTGHTAPNPLASRPAASAPAEVPPAWLATPAGQAAAPADPAAGRARSVRVGPGETLATLAGRIYGDPAMAERIWDANRDRLRSPVLVVPGMELRLP
jgi:nucleoid-associated protein YgaU